MVARKQGNSLKRRGPEMPDNTNPRRFRPSTINGADKRYNNRAGIGAMFNPSQMPDNPGYMDFNEPQPVRPPPVNKVNVKIPATQNNNRVSRRTIQPNINFMPQRNHNNGNNGWMPSPRMPPGQIQNQRPIGPLPGVRNFRNNPMPRGNRHVTPPMGMRPPLPPLPPPPPPPLNMNPTRYCGPRPLLPPPPPVAGCSMGPPPMGPPPMGASRMQMRSAGSVPPMPPHPPRVNSIPPAVGQLRGVNNLNSNRKNLKNRKRNNLPGNTNTRGKKSTTIKKTLSEIVNQYPLNKPWVTDEIRAEQKKKEDIENRLKCNKDDKLFAEFKVQRDKFVKMYEASRLEYIGKHPEQDIDKILTESDKVKAETIAKPKQK